MSDFDLSRLREFAARKAALASEALSLYDPLPFQKQYHANKSKTLILVKGNRVGGSLCGYAEVARAACGKDPYKKYPKENGTIVCLGYGEKHVGNVIYPMLCMPGAFKIIRGPNGKWRTWKPWLQYDKEHEDERMDAPPLIPKRMIKNVAWEDRAKRIFTQIDLINGWKILAANSAGDPNQFQGINVNLYDIDEDLATTGWLHEARARVAFVKGLIRWHAMPHARTNDIVDLIEEGERQEGRAEEKIDTKLIEVNIDQNPHFEEEEREQFKRDCLRQGKDVYRQRILGKLTIDRVLMYSEFNLDDHGLDPDELPNQQVPDNWCRYFILDPGSTPGSAICGAIPPPDDPLAVKYGDIRLVYDEIQIDGANAEKMASEFARKHGGENFYAFIIDEHGSRSRELGTGVPVVVQFSRAFKRHGMKSEMTAHRFRRGTDAVKSRTGEVRNWLGWVGEQPPKLKVLRGRCPNLVSEFRKYKKKQAPNGLVLDEPNVRGIHLCICLEYWAGDNPRYHRPKISSRMGNWVKKRFDRKNKNKKPDKSSVTF